MAAAADAARAASIGSRSPKPAAAAEPPPPPPPPLRSAISPITARASWRSADDCGESGRTSCAPAIDRVASRSGDGRAMRGIGGAMTMRGVGCDRAGRASMVFPAGWKTGSGDRAVLRRAPARNFSLSFPSSRRGRCSPVSGGGLLPGVDARESRGGTTALMPYATDCPPLSSGLPLRGWRQALIVPVPSGRGHIPPSFGRPPFPSPSQTRGSGCAYRRRRGCADFPNARRADCGCSRR